MTERSANDERPKKAKDVDESQDAKNGEAKFEKNGPVSSRETNARELRETKREREAREARERAAVEPLEEPLPGERLPSIPPLPPAGPWRSYKEIVSNLANAIVEGQKPIRVLQGIRWENAVEEQFLKAKARELPKIDAAYYANIDLGFDPRVKAEEFEQIARDVERQLGDNDPIGRILLATAIEYRDVVRMLAARGTPLFYGFSRKLYGSPKDKFPDGKSTVRDLGRLLYTILTNVDGPGLGMQYERNMSAADCVTDLNARFDKYFHDAAVRVEIDDAILADAAAGGDYVKIRSGAKFSSRDIDILEVHEGWVHVATSLNGQQQSVAKWLSKGPPRTTAVQEGLAALLEIFTFRTYPRRARRINDRVLAVDKAEDGANFLEVFDWFRTEGYEEEECFHNTRRVFRGGVIEGGAPFTKDACYCKGIVLNYAFIRSAIQHNHVDLVPFLFVGKVAHEDVPVLARHVTDGVVKPPRYLPPMFRELSGLAIWMAYSTFFSQLGGEEIADHYAKLFARS